MILDCVSKSFKVIPRLFIWLGQLRIIEYVQSQQIVKMSNMESFARIVNKQQLYWKVSCDTGRQV